MAQFPDVRDKNAKLMTITRERIVDRVGISAHAVKECLKNVVLLF